MSLKGSQQMNWNIFTGFVTNKNKSIMYCLNLNTLDEVSFNIGKITDK